MLQIPQQDFAGDLLTEEHAEYHVARRVWNGMIERRPAAIARCRSAEDVCAAVKLARATGARVSVRGGGHNVAGAAVCEGGLMIDLSPMKAIEVDPRRREAVASPGVLWGEFDRATQAFGLATTGGQVSHTGIAGLTLGGGLGYLMGKYGTTCDNLLSVDLVTAEGEMLTCSTEENADLFWAVRGAGANFGIVTSFRYRLHPLGEVLAGLLLHPLERAGELIAFHSEFLRGTPDELDTTLGFLYSPEGVPLVSIIAVYAGDPEEGERVLAPLRAFGPPVADLIRPMPYVEAQSMADALLPIGSRYYWKSSFAAELSPSLGEVLTEGARRMSSQRSLILVFEMKGEVQRIPREAMAFDHRGDNFEMSIVTQWTERDEDERHIRWAREVWGAAQPFVSSAGYVNHMTGDETDERVRAAYGPEKYARLAKLKRTYDPDNFFCLNHNIPPA